MKIRKRNCEECDTKFITYKPMEYKCEDCRLGINEIRTLVSKNLKNI